MTRCSLSATRALSLSLFLFFFNDTATTEIYTLSLHDALPISSKAVATQSRRAPRADVAKATRSAARPEGPKANTSGLEDRKSTRLNSSHSQISYAVFCLKTKEHTSKFDHRHNSSYQCCRLSTS